MEKERIVIIIGMGLVSYVVRVVPQLLFIGRTFPDSFDRYLRYLILCAYRQHHFDQSLSFRLPGIATLAAETAAETGT